MKSKGKKRRRKITIRLKEAPLVIIEKLAALGRKLLSREEKKPPQPPERVAEGDVSWH